MRRTILLAAVLLLTSGCASRRPLPKNTPSPTIPQISVWVAETETLLQMDVETYVAGVVAGEMPSSWPMEALKAQAILARTYVLKFITEKESRYPGADISTDVTEAQAYDATAIDDRILAATQATCGEILLTADNTLPYTWFHAHSGGTTALAREALDWRGAEPPHTRVAPGMEDAGAPESVALWHATFPMAEFIAACQDAGYPIRNFSRLAIGQTGPSGRAVTLQVDDASVNAARLRISLGSTRMRSTLLTTLTHEDGMIHMAGRGYGHGVGLSQWGARAMAEAGYSAQEIALHYYIGLHIHRAW